VLDLVSEAEDRDDIPQLLRQSRRPARAPTVMAACRDGYAGTAGSRPFIPEGAGRCQSAFADGLGEQASRFCPVVVKVRVGSRMSA